MKRLCLFVPVVLWMATTAVGQSPPQPPPRGGLIDSVTRNYGNRSEPSDGRERRGSDLPPGLTHDAPTTPVPSVDPAVIDRLNSQIESMEKFVAERRREIDAPKGAESPAESVDTLKHRLAALRKRREEMRAEYVNADRDAARTFVEKVRQFEAGFAPHVEALRKGDKPSDVSAVDWAAMVDRFQTGQGGLDRKSQELKLRLNNQRQAGLEGVGAAIAELQRQLDALPNAGMEVRRQLTRREAEIALDLAERRLAELRQIRQEYQGQPSDRRNETTGSAPVPDLPPRGGGLAAVIEGIADQLKARGVVPEVGGPLGDPANVAPRGTPGAENLDRGDLLRARMAQLGNDLRNYHDQLAAVRSEVLGEERDELNVRRDIENAKRPVLPPNPSKAQTDEWNRQTAEHRRQMEAELAEMRKEQEKIRDDQITRRTAFLSGQIDRIRSSLEATGKELDALPKEPPP